jgi:hypothetical protein
VACATSLELGDSERALAALEAAMHCPWSPMNTHDPRIDSLRAEPLLEAIYKELFGRLRRSPAKTEHTQRACRNQLVAFR